MRPEQTECFIEVPPWAVQILSHAGTLILATQWPQFRLTLLRSALVISLSHTTQCPHSVTISLLLMCLVLLGPRLEKSQTHSITFCYLSAISKTPDSGISGRIYNQPRAEKPHISDIWEYFTTDSSVLNTLSGV